MEVVKAPNGAEESCLALTRGMMQSLECGTGTDSDIRFRVVGVILVSVRRGIWG
jgi:hypothetical protein